MSLPPMWKVRRELRRAGGDSLRALRGALWEPPRQWLHDRRGGQLLRAGRGALTDRVAVLVLYQPRRLTGSVRLTLEHLAAEGWSVLAVSNAPLTPADMALVTERAALLLERPNVGYDFGGYRAGLRLLADLGHRPEQLVLMNDSTWFPLREGDDSLRRMEALEADMAGHIYKTEYGRGNDHLESHLLMFSPSALAHPVFARFWAGYVMSDDRVTTIRRGEKGISHALMAAGLRVEGLIGRENMLTSLRDLDDAQLCEVLAGVVHHREDAAAHCSALLEMSQYDPDWRDAFLDWVDAALENSLQHLVSATFVEPAMRLHGMGFVKKSRDRRFHLAREKVLELEAAGRIPPLHPDVRAEIATANQSQAASLQ